MFNRNLLEWLVRAIFHKVMTTIRVTNMRSRITLGTSTLEIDDSAIIDVYGMAINGMLRTDVSHIASRMIVAALS